MKKLLTLLALATALLCSNKTQAQCIVDAGPNLNFCCPGGQDTLRATFFDTICPCPNRVYQWTPATGLSNPNVLRPVVTAASNIMYKLCVYIPKKNFCTVGICCTACDSMYVTVNGSCCKPATGTGIATNQLTNKEVKVFPNPAKHTLNVEVAYPLNNAELVIYDNTGKQVFRRKDPYKNTEPIDVSQFAKGLYLIKIVEGENEVYNTKVLVE